MLPHFRARDVAFIAVPASCICALIVADSSDYVSDFAATAVVAYFMACVAYLTPDGNLTLICILHPPLAPLSTHQTTVMFPTTIRRQVISGKKSKKEAATILKIADNVRYGTRATNCRDMLLLHEEAGHGNKLSPF